MKIRCALVLLVLLWPVLIIPQTIDDGILLYVTKVSNTQYHLQWTDSTTHYSSCSNYMVYGSTDPTVLGKLLGVVHGTQADIVDTSNPSTLWFFQVIHPGDRGLEWSCTD
jgi:hypothetical protein